MYIITSWETTFFRLSSLDLEGETTVNQPSYLYNTFCQALDAGKEARAIFYDISKAFDRVWHAGLIHKLKLAGISGNLLSWFTNYRLVENKGLLCLVFSLPGILSQLGYLMALYLVRFSSFF